MVAAQMVPERPRSRSATGPLSRVLSAFRAGAVSLDQIAEQTGLAPTIVRTSVAHLIRMGRIQAKELSMGCPGGGCAACASATADGTPGCGAAGPSPQRRGPVLVQLTLRA